MAPDAKLRLHEENRLAREIVAKYPRAAAERCLPLLHLARRAARRLAAARLEPRRWTHLGMARIRVYEVATFYDMYNIQPSADAGRVCTTTPCWLCGSDEVLPRLTRSGSTSAAHRGRALLPARVRVPGCLRQRAHDVDRRRLLRGPRLRQGAGDHRGAAAWRAAATGPQSGRKGSEPLGGKTTLLAKDG
jgi:hypothetical protein